MNAKSFLVVLFMVAVGLLFSGCEDSKNPLSDPQKSKPDNRLSGAWRLREPVAKHIEAIYFHVGAAGDKLPAGVMRAVQITHFTDGTIGRPVEFLIFSTTIGKNTYLNIAPGGDECLKVLKEKGWRGVEGYVLLKYKVEADTVLGWKMDSDAKVKAIDAGKIKGKDWAKPGFLLMDTYTITDTTENVARFVAGAGDSLFSENAMHLDRVK